MRRTETVEIKGGRDAGKKYLITEMDAESAEWWAFRALQAIAGAEAELNFQSPLADMAAQGIKALAKVHPDQAKPLLDEMMGCVAMVIPAGGTRPLMAGDIEDVTTRITLRKAVMGLHLGFSIGGDEQI